MSNTYINKEIAKLRFTDWYHETYTDDQIIKILDDIPAADVVEVQHGKWIQKGRKIYCSKCNRGVYIGTDDDDLMQDEMRLRHFCSACGAKMDGGENND